MKTRLRSPWVALPFVALLGACSEASPEKPAAPPSPTPTAVTPVPSPTPVPTPEALVLGEGLTGTVEQVGDGDPIMAGGTGRFRVTLGGPDDPRRWEGEIDVILAEGRAMPALLRGAAGMKLGERRRLLAAPELCPPNWAGATEPIPLTAELIAILPKVNP
jgi:hypothetical protein